MGRSNLKFREMNKRLTPAICKKTLEDAEKTEAEFADCFTAAVTGDSIDELYQVSIRNNQSIF